MLEKIRDLVAAHAGLADCADLSVGAARLLGAALAWLRGPDDPRIAPCQVIAETAKAAQFQLARAVARGRFDGFAKGLEPASLAWDRMAAAAVPHAA